MIADEVQTGLGRTGEHMWGFMNYEVHTSYAQNIFGDFLLIFPPPLRHFFFTLSNVVA